MNERRWQDGFESGPLMRAWLAARKENIHQRVRAADVLSRHGVSLKYHGDREEQFSCPFHGADNKPSVKYFIEENGEPSHVWCFVCQERWDCIALWKRFTGTSKYSTVLAEIERAFALTVPESGLPRGGGHRAVDPELEQANDYLEQCERLLRLERERIEMPVHLKLGSILDQLRFAIERKHISGSVGKERALLLLRRIGEKSRGKKTAPADKRDG